MTKAKNHLSDPQGAAERLQLLRQEINQLDEQLLSLLNKRAQRSILIGKIKSGNSEAVFKPLREKDVLYHLLKKNPGPLPSDHLQAIYREILSSSRSLQQPQRVVYLGPEGTFSFLAARNYLGYAAKFLPCSDLEDIFRMISKNEAELGIIPLENSLQGSVGQSLDLFLRYNVYIQAEVYFRISHSLLSSSPSIQDINRVYSHAKALEQCTQWLGHHLPQAEIIPVESTAAAAQLVQGRLKEAAIAHCALAHKYSLHILQTNIDDLPENWTRFLIISSSPPPPGEYDKSSLLFTIADKPGALASVLNILAREGINMQKLESRPLRSPKWQYIFFADVQCNLHKEGYSILLKQLQSACTFLRVLGSYPHGPHFDLNSLDREQESL